MNKVVVHVAKYHADMEQQCLGSGPPEEFKFTIYSTPVSHKTQKQAPKQDTRDRHTVQYTGQAYENVKVDNTDICECKTLSMLQWRNLTQNSG